MDSASRREAAIRRHYRRRLALLKKENDTLREIVESLYEDNWSLICELEATQRDEP